jgi:ubiquinone/menaquinone biosynthesis C-methylase UbiE
MMFIKKISHLLLLIVVANLAVIRGQAQHDDHTHSKSDHEISSDSLEIINQIYDEEWNQWRDSLFGVDIEEGMKIGEVGAGNGEFAAIMAEKVGPDGFIYANDVVPSKINKIKDLIASKNIKNMVGILGEENDALFPDNDLDMAIMVEVYHHLENPSIFLDNLKRYLVKNGRLVIIEPDVNQPGGTLNGCYSDPETTRNVLSELGYNNISIFYKKIFNLDLYVLQANVN